MSIEPEVRPSRKLLSHPCQCGHERRRHYLSGSVYTACLEYRRGRFCQCQNYVEKNAVDKKPKTKP